MAMILEVDINGDGTISLEEFEKIMQLLIKNRVDDDCSDFKSVNSSKNNICDNK
jgi:EF hand